MGKGIEGKEDHSKRGVEGESEMEGRWGPNTLS